MGVMHAYKRITKMGADAPIPLNMMNVAATCGAFCAAVLVTEMLNLLAPPCLKRGPEAGEHHIF